ncbi:MAG TPA: 50S ribosomal protein L11 methyltransferase [Gaiellaceae bacterium]
MIALFPEGFEELESPDGLELVAYTDARGEERLWQVFGGAGVADVEAGWEERWRQFHRPVRIGPLWIGPPWEAPPADAIAVVVDPGAAFGTGAHPTTRLSIELLATLPPTGSLLDVGCGSGVLAIAAAKLGFAPVAAVDVEAQAVSETQRNAAANAVTVEARCVDALHAQLPPMYVAVANVTLAAVETLARRLVCDRLVTSGYLVSDEPALPGWDRVERRELEGWAADLSRPAVRRAGRGRPAVQR